MSPVIGIKRIEEVVKNTWISKNNERNPIENLKIAAHPGCHYNRPSEILQWDDPNNPKYQEYLIKAIGGIPINYEEKTLCCGFGLQQTRHRIRHRVLFEINRRKYQSITDAGAQLIAVNCPSCFQTLESNQHLVNKMFEENYTIPIFYITELMALAFGYKPEEIGIKFHAVGKNLEFFKD